MRKGSGVSAGFIDTAFGQRRWTVWALLFLFWLALGLFSAGQILVELPPIRRTPPPPGVNIGGRMFAWQLATWLVWAALVPVALWLRKRFPLERGALWRSVPAHLGAIVLLCATHTIALLLLRSFILPTTGAVAASQLIPQLIYWWVRDLPFCALLYGLILGIGSALDYQRKFRERELRASQLEAQLAQSQLQMLRMQLHPHFLFNTLNGITGLVRDRDHEAAVQMLVGLSELLRQTLENSGKQETPLHEELAWLELYLNIQQMRFSDRLRISVNAAPETADALVPNLITQPLVENSIRHGLASRVAPGEVSISAQSADGRLELRVCDDGVGLPDSWQMDKNKGLGLTNTAARLRQLYGSDFKLELRNRERGGVEALISIPLRKDLDRIAVESVPRPVVSGA